MTVALAVAGLLLAGLAVLVAEVLAVRRRLHRLAAALREVSASAERAAGELGTLVGSVVVPEALVADGTAGPSARYGEASRRPGSADRPGQPGRTGR